MKKIILGVTSLVIVGLTSCEKDAEIISLPDNIVAPATYEFNRGNESSVSYSGQTTRIQMAEELTAAMMDTNKTVAQLKAIFDHQADSNDFSSADLNASDKSVRSKVAASLDYYSANSTDANTIKTTLDSWVEKQVTEVFPNWDVAAEVGKAGYLLQSDAKQRYVNAKGFEYNQLVAKSLIGGLMTDQIVNNYLSPAKLDGGTNRENHDNDILEDGKNYTKLEHAWDEAFGYLYGKEADASNPSLSADGFLNKYLGKVEADSDFTGIAAKIHNAFKIGRAAIASKNYTLRDQQAEIIKENISKVIAIRAVYYLQSGKAKLESDKGSAFHALSEGYGFIYSLQFTRKPNTLLPYFSKEEVQNMIDKLNKDNGLWDITPATLDELSNQISSKFNFTTEQAAN